MRDLVIFMVALALGIISTATVAPSLFQSSTSATATMIAQEVASIRMSSLLWVSNSSTTGDFTGIEADVIGGAGHALPDMVVTGSGATSTLASKVANGVTYTISASGGNKTVTITVDGLGAYEAGVKAKVATTPATITDTSPTDGILVFVYNG